MYIQPFIKTQALKFPTFQITSPNEIELNQLHNSISSSEIELETRQGNRQEKKIEKILKFERFPSILNKKNALVVIVRNV